MMTDVTAFDTETLTHKVREVFGDLAIDKRRLPDSQLTRRNVPGYVAEWVLDSVVPGEGELTSAEADKVQKWAGRVIPGANDQNLIKNRLATGEMVKILTHLQIEVILNRTRQESVGNLNLIGIKDAHVPPGLAEQHPALLQQGMWGITELVSTKDGPAVVGFKPMQATVDISLWKEARSRFTIDEWRALLVTSMGYNPAAFTLAEQSLLLCRLLPLVQKSMHLIELAPKGTGKSYIFENISPRVRLISGGNVSPAVLFVNNQNGVAGLLARFAVVVLDEVQTLKFEKPEEIVGGLKGFLANGRLTRGGLHELSSDCGFVMLANIALDERLQPIHDPVTYDLPKFLQETAFLDRIRGIIPGWKIPKLTRDSFATSLGLKADFFGDALLELREDLSHDQYVAMNLTWPEHVFKRNTDSVQMLASGLRKLLFPHGEHSPAEFYRHCVEPAIDLRQRVWDVLYATDTENHKFGPDIHCTTKALA
jgi:ATP-dependent Lon protease